MAQIKLTPLEDLLDDFYGKEGTPKRDEHDARVAEAVHAYEIGEAIKEARLKQSLTQEQLGERIGVKKAQISRLERGYSISLPTIAKVFSALGISVNLNFVGMKEVPIC